MKIKLLPACQLLILITLVPFLSFSQNSVLTQHNDLYRTGWDNHETVLTTANVAPSSFGLLFSRPVDDQIYAQPLVVSNINLPGYGTKNIVITATVNNTVYAFDADSGNVTSPYWQVNLTPVGSRVIKNTDMTGACGGNYKDFSGNIGIVGTPVIDSTTNTMYLVARSVTSAPDSDFQQYLHALDITTGAERPNSPVLITAQVVRSLGGFSIFTPQQQNQRAGLMLLNGIVYITWASHCDWSPYHGWVIGYDKSSLQQDIVYNTTPTGGAGGIWMSGAAPSADDAGNIYLAVGNGTTTISADRSTLINSAESALKLTLAGNTLAVSSFFVPYNYSILDSVDNDFGVAGMLLIPNSNRVLTGCKNGNLYLLNRDSMGGYDSLKNDVIQTITVSTRSHGLRSSLAYYKGAVNEYIYSWSESAPLSAFPFDRTADTLNVLNAQISGVQGPASGNGSFFSLSSNGSVDSTAVLWVNQSVSGNANQATRLGILRAFSAIDVTHELWNSSMDSADMPGNYSKFNCPTISNGKVYLATFSNKLMVYGLRAPDAHDSCNSFNVALNKAATASSSQTSSSPSAAFDGNLFTGWISNNSDNQWIYVDLGARYDLCEVLLEWGTGLGGSFQIQVSEDSMTWTTLRAITGNASFENYIPVRGSGRYVRMLGISRGANSGYSLWEFQVYGKLSANQVVGTGVLCPGGNTTLNANVAASTYQWQVNTGLGFTNISLGGNYSGTSTATLQLSNIPSSWYGYQYRCVVDSFTTSPVTLIFKDTWTGSVDQTWENPGNWSCGALPDSFTDVYVNSGTVIVSSNPGVRTLTLATGVNFTVTANYRVSINYSNQ